MADRSKPTLNAQITGDESMTHQRIVHLDGEHKGKLVQSLHRHERELLLARLKGMTKPTVADIRMQFTLEDLQEIDNP